MTNNIYIDFGIRLSKIRVEKGLSQKQIAEQLGIAQTTYSGYENGVRKIPLEIIVKLSNLLDVSPTTLITGAEPQTTKNPPANSADGQLLELFKLLSDDNKEKITELLRIFTWDLLGIL